MIVKKLNDDVYEICEENGRIAYFVDLTDEKDGSCTARYYKAKYHRYKWNNEDSASIESFERDSQTFSSRKKAVNSMVLISI